LQSLHLLTVSRRLAVWLHFGGIATGLVQRIQQTSQKKGGTIAGAALFLIALVIVRGARAPRAIT
jgi:hypothetical protein